MKNPWLILVKYAILAVLVIVIGSFFECILLLTVPSSLAKSLAFVLISSIIVSIIIGFLFGKVLHMCVNDRRLKEFVAKQSKKEEK